MAQQHAALRSNIALLGYNPGMSSAQQPYSNGAIRRGDETVILPPPPTLRFAPQGYTNDKPPTQAIHRPHSTAPITPGDRPQSLGTNNSTQKSSLSSARTRDRSPIAGSNTRVRTATPEYWPAQSSDNGQGMKNATPTGSRPEITPSHSTSNTRILPPNQGKHVEVTPSRVNSSTGILPPTQDHQNSANDLTHPPSHIQLPNDDLRPSSDVSRKPRSRFESLLIESANTSNESTENAIRLSKEIKSLVKQNTANEHDYKTIMGAASGFLEVRANCRALLTGKITPDGFVRTFLKNASERRTLSRNVGQEEKVGIPNSSQFENLPPNSTLHSQVCIDAINGLKEPRGSMAPSSETPQQMRIYSSPYPLVSSFSAFSLTKLQNYLVRQGLDCHGTRGELIARCESEHLQSSYGEVAPDAPVQESEKNPIYEAAEVVSSTENPHLLQSMSGNDQPQQISLLNRAKSLLGIGH
jgi:hypothetical protein